MRRILLAAAIFLAGLGAANAQDMPDKGLIFNISDYINGSAWFDDGLKNVGFEISKRTNWPNGEERTVLHFGYSYTFTNGHRWGYVDCTVPNDSIAVTQAKGTFNVQILDPSDPSVDCAGLINEYVDGVYLPPVPWTFPIEVTGYMSDPSHLLTLNSNLSETDSIEGTSFRYSCLGADATNARNGGFSALLPETEDFRYFAFGEAWGEYHYNDCRALLKPPKK